MLNPLFSLGVYLIEMLISYIFYSSLVEHKFTTIKTLLIGVGLFTLGSTVNILLRNNGAINALTTWLINVCFAYFCFDSSLTKSMFYAAILGIVNVALEVSVVTISSFVVGGSFLSYNDNFLLLVFQTITIKTLYFLITLLLIRALRPGDDRGTVPLDFLVYPASTTVCQTIFWHICSQPTTSRNVQILLSVSSACLFISTIFLFFAYSHQVKKERQTIQIQSELSRLQTEQSYYQILDQQNQELMIYAHDAKKHLAAIQALNEDPAIGSYVTKLSEQLKDYSKSRSSGNKLLDVMLHKYDIDCKMRGITFEYDVKVCNLSQLEDMDLVAILGNLLDNAVTASEKSIEKSISLTTVYRNRYSVIIVSNSCDTPPKQSGHHLISTKSGAGFHGFGMKSVAKSIQKYDGDYEWEYDGEKRLFTVTVMLGSMSQFSDRVSPNSFKAGS